LFGRIALEGNDAAEWRAAAERQWHPEGDGRALPLSRVFREATTRVPVLSARWRWGEVGGGRRFVLD